MFGWQVGARRRLRRGRAGNREPEANCSVNVVDPVLKPIVYPDTTQALAVPAAVAFDAEVRPTRLAASPAFVPSPSSLQANCGWISSVRGEVRVRFVSALGGHTFFSAHPNILHAGMCITAEPARRTRQARPAAKPSRPSPGHLVSLPPPTLLERVEDPGGIELCIRRLHFL